MNTRIRKVSEFSLPLGAALTLLGRQYAGALSLSLESCGADRYVSILLFLNDQLVPIKQQQLSDSLNIDKASLVRMLDYLQEKKLVKRSINPSSRREYLLELSTTGRKKIPAVKKAIADTDACFFRGISERDRKKFLALLKKISINAEVVPVKPVSIHFKHLSKTT